MFAVRIRGGNSLALAYTSFGSTPATAGSCTIEYNRVANTFGLLNDAGLDWISPAGGVLANGQCTVTSPSAALGTDNLLVVLLPVAFRASFYGPRNSYILADGSGWRQRGS